MSCLTPFSISDLRKNILPENDNTLRMERHLACPHFHTQLREKVKKSVDKMLKDIESNAEKIEKKVDKGEKNQYKKSR